MQQIGDLHWYICLKSAPKISAICTAFHGEQKLTERYHTMGWAILLFHYIAEMVVDDIVLPIHPGFVGVFPPRSNILIRYRGKSMHRYAHFSLQGGRGGEIPISTMSDLGKDFKKMDSAAELAIRTNATNPERTSMILWDILWQLAEKTPSSTSQKLILHPALRCARELIELRLSENIWIEELAKECNLSHRQLSNLFRAHLGMTVSGYLRSRRVERAKQLLTQTTQPIKRIAADVGIPDLHAFNKVIRRELGKPPRQIRRKG